MKTSPKPSPDSIHVAAKTATLIDATALQKLNTMLAQFIDLLPEHVKSEGIFRISGSAQHIEENLKAYLEDPNHCPLKTLKDLNNLSINDITGLIKAALVQFSRSPFTLQAVNPAGQDVMREFKKRMLAHADDADKDERISVQELIAQLIACGAHEEAQLFYQLMHIGQQIIDAEDENKMGSQNITTALLGPKILDIINKYLGEETEANELLVHLKQSSLLVQNSFKTDEKPHPHFSVSFTERYPASAAVCATRIVQVAEETEMKVAREKQKIHSILMAATQERPVFYYSQTKIFKTPDNLLNQIKEIENELLAAKGPLIEIDGKKMRVFNGDQAFQVHTHDLYARGLQHAYAMLKIASFENSEIDEGFIRQCLLKYSEDMGWLYEHTPENFERARKNTLDFVGMMSFKLAEARLAKLSALPDDEKALNQLKDEYYQQAFKDLKKGTELYTMLEPSEESICTVMTKDSGYELQISEKLSFAAPQDPEAQKETAWYKQGKKNHGPWFEKFMEKHLADVMTQSPPCTTRDMPNPSNAWQEKNISLDSSGKILHQEEKVRFAISSPFNIKDKKARVSMAVDGMEKLLSEERLQKIAQEYIKRWGPLLAEGEAIDIDLLHQTLVAPTFFYGADRDMMAVKKASNAEVLRYLQGLDIEVEGRKVNFRLGQVNNCINMWHPVIIPTDNDITDSNHLVSHVAQLITKLDSKIPAAEFETREELKLVQAFLNNQKRSWLTFEPFSHKAPTAAQQQAIDKISEKLFNGKLGASGLSQESQKDLSLMLQAAVNLKKLNHESQLGWAMRKVKNAIRIKEVPILAPVVSLIASPIYVGKYVTKTAGRLFGYFKDGAPPRIIDAFVPTRNAQTAKSAYESILSSKLGISMGGCKSAYDREGEANVHRAAMVSQFNQSGQIFDASVSDRKYYEYLEEYVKPAEESGHQNHVAAHVDRTGGRKMWESRTHHYEISSKEEKKILRGNAAKFRKIAKPPTKKEKEAMLLHYSPSALERFTVDTQNTLDTWLSQIGQYCIKDNKSKNILSQKECKTKVHALLGEEGTQKLYAKAASVETTSARAAFLQYLHDYVLNNPDNRSQAAVNAQATNMQDFLGEEGLRLYKAAIAEERNSAAFRNAVFLKSVKHYDGGKWDKRLVLWVGGPSASGKSFGAEGVVRRLDQDIMVHSSSDLSGNDVVSVDGGIERDVSQMRQMVLQVALSKGFKGIDNLHSHTKLGTKKYVREAAFATSDLNIVLPNTFTASIPKGFKADTMRKIAALPNVAQVFCDVQAEKGQGHRFKRSVGLMGDSRAWYMAKTPYAREKITMLAPNTGAESKRYEGGIKFLAGVAASSRAKQAYLSACKEKRQNPICLVITNDLIFLKLDSTQQQWVECGDKENRAKLGDCLKMSARDFAAWQSFVPGQSTLNLNTIQPDIILELSRLKEQNDLRAWIKYCQIHDLLSPAHISYTHGQLTRIRRAASAITPRYKNIAQPELETSDMNRRSLRSSTWPIEPDPSALTSEQVRPVQNPVMDDASLSHVSAVSRDRAVSELLARENTGEGMAGRQASIPRSDMLHRFSQEKAPPRQEMTETFVKYAQLRMHLQAPSNCQRYNINSVRERNISNKQTVEMVFNADNRSTEKIVGYGIKTKEDDVVFALQQNLTVSNRDAGIRKLCQIAVDMARPGDEFNLENSPVDKRAQIAEIFEALIQQAIQDKKFTAEDCPKVIGKIEPKIISARTQTLGG